MFNWKDFERVQNIFGQVGAEHYRMEWGQHHVDLRPKDLVRWLEMLKDDLGYLTLVDMAGVDRLNLDHKTGCRFELVYHFLNMGNHQRLNLHLLVNPQEIIPSIVSYFPHADWMEREQSEMLGLKFDRTTPSLLLPIKQTNYPLKQDAVIKKWPADGQTALPSLRINPNKSEAPYPEEFYTWKKFDVISAQTHGLFEWLVCFDPQNVVQSELKVGFHHQGFEKILEGFDWVQVLQLVDKIHIGVAPTYSIAWAKTVEDSYRIKIPERAQAIRIVMLELARITEHLTVLSEMTFALKLDEYRLFINCREKVYELFEKYCGRRQGLGIPSIGGVRDDLPHGWIIEYQNVAEILNKQLKVIHHSLISQRNFRSRLEGSSVNAQTVLAWGVSGPAMRASGLNFDLRKSQPFYFYRDIDFDIPVGIYGTAYDRYLIRLEEIFQSVRIVTQVIDNLPLGEIINPDFSSLLLDKAQLPPQHSWHFCSLESPNGEAGFFHLPGLDFHPYRIKIKTPSFALAQALPQFMLGLGEDQLTACLASLGIRSLEMDR